MNPPVLYIFAGPNGSGKSTITSLFKDTISSFVYVNADDLKKKYDMTDQEAFDKANLIRANCLKQKISFSTETVFSHPSKIEFMKDAKKLGYEVNLIFVTTYDANINLNRVEFRVLNGGHDVPPDRIVSRYERTMKLLPEAVALSDSAIIYNNSLDRPVVILRKEMNDIEIFPQPYPSRWTSERLLQLKNEIELQMDPLKGS